MSLPVHFFLVDWQNGADYPLHKELVLLRLLPWQRHTTCSDFLYLFLYHLSQKKFDNSLLYPAMLVLKFQVLSIVGKTSNLS
ncbi:Uncharacterised protein [Streptococcus pneumoniae]|nr:Uncharacterised protein [Streptococcus pneumoniae]